MELPNYGGSEATVLGLTWKPGEVEVYDIEVEGLHNFYVRGPGSDAAGVLVHNSTAAKGAPRFQGDFEITLANDSYIQATVDGDELFVDMMSVPFELQRTGQSRALLREALDKAGDVKSVGGGLAYTNESAYMSLLDEGLSPTEAASWTPFGKILREAGYSRFEFNESTMVLTGFRGQ